MSRWTMPAVWAASNASAISMPSVSSVSISSGRRAMRCLSVGAFQVLHDDEGAAVLLADVINRADVRVIQSGSGPGLALETGRGLWIAGDFVQTET